MKSWPWDSWLLAALLGIFVANGVYLVWPTPKTPWEPTLLEHPLGSPIEPVAQAAEPVKHGASHGRSSAHKKVPATSVSLNKSTADQLAQLPGVGPALAKRIIDYRKTHGHFATVEELLDVKGIGKKKFAKMQKYLRL